MHNPHLPRLAHSRPSRACYLGNCFEEEEWRLEDARVLVRLQKIPLLSDQLSIFHGGQEGDLLLEVLRWPRVLVNNTTFELLLYFISAGVTGRCRQANQRNVYTKWEFAENVDSPKRWLALVRHAVDDHLGHAADAF